MTTQSTASWRSGRPWLNNTTVCDGLFPWTEQFLPPNSDLVTQLTRFKASGIDHVSITVAAGKDGTEQALTTLGRIRNQLFAARIPVLHTKKSIQHEKERGNLSVSFHFQSCTPFSNDLDLVDAFFAAGVRRAILAYNEANIFADGCHELRNSGLSALGYRLIERMDAVGMVVDLSHCGVRTTFDAMEMKLAHSPIFSHSNARALYDHARNITDAQIRTAAEHDMYIGINGVGFFLGAEQDKIPAEMARHIAHIAEIAGSEKVGIGADFMFLEGSNYSFYQNSKASWPRGYREPPWGFLQPEQFGQLVEALEKKGFQEKEIIGILGKNYLNRVTR